MKKILLTIMFLVGVTSAVLAQEAPKSTAPVAQTTEVTDPKLSAEDQEFLVKLQATVGDSINHSVSIFEVNKKGAGTCTGVIIVNSDAGAVVLTAKHCVEAGAETFVDAVPVTKSITSPNHDLAVMITSVIIPNKTAISGGRNADPAEDVFAVGYPNAQLYVVLGKVMLYSSKDGFAKMDIIPGCSGGGMFALDGSLIGINVAAFGKELIPGNPLISVFETMDSIKEFLSTVKLD